MVSTLTLALLTKRGRALEMEMRREGNECPYEVTDLWSEELTRVGEVLGDSGLDWMLPFLSVVPGSNSIQ